MIRLLSIASVLFLSALPGTADPPGPAEILALHARAGGSAASFAAAGDLDLEGEILVGGERADYRLRIRREPFAWREDVGALGDDAPYAVLCDGRRALRTDAAGARFLTGHEAVAVLDRVFFEGGLYLDPKRRGSELHPRGRAVLGETDAFRATEDVGRAVHALQLHAASGTTWLLLIDATDGRLLGRQSPYGPRLLWATDADFEPVHGLLLPARRAEGIGNGEEAVERRLSRMTANVTLEPGLFAALEEEPPPVRRIAPLRVLASAMPGTGLVHVEQVRIDGRPPFEALLDTAATRLTLDERTADRLALPLLARKYGGATHGRTRLFSRFVDRLEIGSFSWPQVPASATPLPGTIELPPDDQSGVVIGTDLLFDHSAVLDLAEGALLLRAAPVTPLAAIPAAGGEQRGAPILLPLEEREHRLRFIEIEVQGRTLFVVLDTGAPWVLRLYPSGLERLGLPVDPAEWQRRGAEPHVVGGAGGVDGLERTELVVPFAEVRLGPIVFTRPLVLIAPSDGADDVPGMLGCGALLPFGRIGLDAERSMLEIDPGPSHARTAGGLLFVPEAPPWLGLVLGSGMRRPRSEAEGLPIVLAVHEGSRAQQAGVREGERVVAIDGDPCAGSDLSNVNRRLWLEEGKRVVLTLRDAAGATREVTLD